MSSIRDFVKSHAVLRVPLSPIVRLARKVFRPEHERRFAAFRDLWTVRSVLLPKDRLPGLQQAGFYGFAVE